MNLKITEGANGIRFNVKVQPRSSRNGIQGIHGNALKINLTAPPVDGAANEALIDFLAKHFKVAKKSIIIIQGESNRNKVVQIMGLTKDELLNAIAGKGKG